IDNFGNVLSNINRLFFEKASVGYKDFFSKFRNLALNKIYHPYTEFITDWSMEHEYHRKSAAIFNDAGHLKLTIYKGNRQNGAKTLFGLQVGERIYIQFL